MVNKEPKSFIDRQVVGQITKELKAEKSELLLKGDSKSLDRVTELDKARRLITEGAWTIRRENRFLNYLNKCSAGKSGTLSAQQEKVRQCSLEWAKKTEEEKAKFGGSRLVTIDHS